MELVEEIKRAVEYTKQKEYKKAEKLYLELLKEHPENPSLLSFLGILYFNLDKYKQAEKYLEKSYKLSPSKTILSFIGLSKFFLSKYLSSVFYLEKAEKIDKSYAIYNALLSALYICEDYAKAYYYAKKALKQFPLNEKIIYYVGFSALSSGKFQESEQYVHKLLICHPKSTDAWWLKGLTAELLYSDEEEARKCYRKMVRYGSKAKGYMNLAISYSKEAKYRKKAYYYLRKFYDLHNGHAFQINFTMASYYLSARKFKKGYKYYVCCDFVSQEDRDWYNRFKNRWQGGTYKDETLLVYGDQGLGDQLQFIRYIPYLAKKFKKVKVMIDESLIDLSKLSYKTYKNVVFYPIKDIFPRYDKSLWLSHSLYYLKMDFKHIPYSAGYLISDYKKIEEYKTKYFNIDKFKIGICWEAGSPGLRDQIHRTLNVELFEDIINLPDSCVYSFQVKSSLENYKKYPNLIDLGSTFKDFSDTAAALKNLDVFITVDTSAAHLAGALGVKTFLLLPYCTDWRWFDNTETTEWYDSVNIFKQTCKNSWENEFKRMQQELTLMIKK